MFILFLSSVVLLYVLSICVVLVAFCCFLFPIGLHAKRKGAKVLLLASSGVLLWVALFVCRFVLCELLLIQSVNIVTKFYIKILATGAANFFALACVFTCVVVFPFHISCVWSVYILSPFGYSAASGITKLFAAVSILSASPAIQATEK